MNTAQHLRASAAVMRERGMAKGYLVTHTQGEERVCALGAMGVALLEANGDKVHYTGDDTSQHIWTVLRKSPDSAAAMAKVIREQYPAYDDKYADSPLIATWNNAPERTQDEVEAVFEKAAVQAEELVA